MRQLKPSSTEPTTLAPLPANQPNSKPSSKTGTDTLDHLLKQGWLKQDQIWRASRSQTLQGSASGTSTGYDKLDALLANNGWPNRGLTEVLHEQTGLGELRLLIPALANLSQTQNRWIILISPPYIPYAPALSHAGIDLKKLLIVTPSQPKDQLWALEKAMASSSCSAVLSWPGPIDHSMNYKQLRRLQVASKTGDCLGVLYRSVKAAHQASPAELRIQLQSHQDDSAVSDRSVLSLQILKRKGAWATEPFQLALQDKLNQLTPEFDELHIPQWQQQQPDLVYMEQLSKDQHVFQ